MHAKVFSIQIFQYLRQILPRFCTLVLFINIFLKGDRKEPVNYRGITLCIVVGKVFCNSLNNRLVQCLEKGGALHEGQVSFKIKFH